MSCESSRPRAGAKTSTQPSSTHQNATLTGSFDPKGNGAPVTATINSHAESLTCHSGARPSLTSFLMIQTPSEMRINAQRLGVDAQGIGIASGCDHDVQELEEFGDFDGLGVGREENILVMHLHPRREEIACWIAQVRRVDDRHRRPVEFRAIDAEELGKLARLAPIEEHGTWICLNIEKAASLSKRFGKRDAPSAEGELPLLTGRAEREEGLRLLIEIDRIARPSPDIVAGLIDQCAKGNSGALAVALKHDPGVLALV